MDWATLAISSAALFAAVNIIDKYLIERLVRDVRTYYVLISVLGAAIGAVILLLNPLEPGVPMRAVGFAVAAGVIESGGLMLLFFTLRTEEVSRAVPVTQTFPVFVAIMAAIFLSETLSLIAWVAIVVTVLGAIVVSARRAPGGSILLSRSFLLLVISSFAIAVARILSKEALADLSSWTLVGLFFICLATGMFAVGARRPFLKEAYEIARRPLALSLIVVDVAIALVAQWVQFAAIALGSVSLVSALVATRPLFLFVYATLVSWLIPRFVEEPLTPRVLAVKFVGIGLIVVGVSQILMA